MSGMSAGMALMIPCVLLLLNSGALFAYQIENGIHGGSVYFYESIPIEDNPAIQWIFKDDIIAHRFPGGTPVCVGQYAGRCALYANGTLRLDRLTSAEEGNYTMTAQYPNSTLIKRSLYGLRVYSALFAYQVENGIHGGSVYFYESIPVEDNPIIQWVFKDDIFAQRFPGGTPVCVGQYAGRCALYVNGTLRLDHLTSADDGNYTMTAQYPNNTLIKRSLYGLRVYSAAFVYKVENGIHGGSVYFYESIPVEDNPVIQWVFKDAIIAQRFPGGDPVCSGQYEGRCALYINGTLRLDRLTSADDGNYTMTAQYPNTTLIKRSSYGLRVYSAVFAYQVENGIHGGSVYFYESIPVEDNPAIQWAFKDDIIAQRFPGGTPVCVGQYAGRCTLYVNGTLRLDRLTSADDGNYTMTAQYPNNTLIKRSLYGLRVYSAVFAYQVENGIHGGSVYFYESIPVEANPAIQWVFKDDIIAQCFPGGTPVCVGQYAGRCTLYVNGTLRLDRLTSADDGNYTMTAQYPNTTLIKRSLYGLRVYSAAFVYQVENGIHGGSVYFYESIPVEDNPVIQWVFKDAIIAQRFPGGDPVCVGQYEGRCALYINGTLRLDRLTSADDGNYTMTAQYPNTTLIKRSFYGLRVYSAVFAYQVENGIHGGSVYFYESIPVEDNPAIQWTFKDYIFAQRFPGGTPVCVGQYAGRCALYVNGTLRLDRLTSADDGNYTMTAQYPNSTLIKRSLYGLRVYSAAFVYQVENGIHGGSVYFYESIPVEDNPVIQWAFKDDIIAQRFPGGDPVCVGQYAGRCALYINGTLRLDRLTSADDGNYTMTAQYPNTTLIKRSFYGLRVYSAVFAYQVENGIHGGSVYFYESIPVEDNPAIQWAFKDDIIAQRFPGGTPVCVGQYAGRCTLYVNGTLRLDRLTSADDGNYTMTAQYPNSTLIKRSLYGLRVYSAAFVYQVENGIHGGSVYFYESIPVEDNPVIQWVFKDAIIAQRFPGGDPVCVGQYAGRCTLYVNGTLRLDRLTSADEGNYTMTAQYPNSTLIKRSLYGLRVYSAVFAYQVENGIHGGSVYFYESIPVEANPAIQWIFKDDIIAQRFPGGTPVCVGQYAGRCALYVNGTLRLDRLTSADDGNYTMTAQYPNTTLIKRSLYGLRVYSAAFVYQVENGIHGGSVYFYESIPVEDNPVIQWVFKDAIIAQRFPGGTPMCVGQYAGRCALYINGTLRLDRLTSADDGNYTMTAQYPNTTLIKRSFYGLRVYSAVFAYQVENGIHGGSVYFYESIPVEDNPAIQWVFKDDIIAQRFPGGTPVCVGQYAGRCALYVNGTLRLDRLTSADEGNYTMSAQYPNTTLIKRSLYGLRVYSALFAYQVENGIHGGSVYFYESIPVEDNPAIQWAFKDDIIAQRFPGGTPVCVGQYAGRCALYVNGTLRLDRLTSADDGNYTMTAQYPNTTLIKRSLYGLRVYSAAFVYQVENGIHGGSVYFYESIPVEDNPVIQWVFKDAIIAQRFPGGDPVCVGQYAGRCALYINGTLRLDRLTSADDGNYTMTAQYPNTTLIKRSFYGLRVYSLVSDVKLTSNISGVVWPGLDSVSLNCSARGTNVNYSWSLQGAALPHDSRYYFTENNTVLTISPVTANDNGTFTCTASGFINNETSNGINLTLGSGISVVTLTGSTSGSYIWVGEDSVSLNCSSDGSNVTFSWKLNGGSLPPGPQYHISSQGDSPAWSNLLISPVSKTDAGPFTCEASNPLGYETSNALNLSLAWRPEGNIACTTVPEEQNIELGCSWSGGNPAANVSLTFSGTTTIETNNVTSLVSIGDIFQGSDLICHGDQLGRTSQCTMRIGPPLAIGHDNSTTTDTKVGGTLNLTVTLEPGLPANFTWLHSLSSQSKESIQRQESTVISTNFSSSYLIQDVTVEDAGKYECIAKNIIGTRSFLFTVTVTKNVVSPMDGLSGGAIAGIVIGVLAGVALIGIAVFFIVKKKTHIGCNKRVSEPEHHLETQENQVYVNVPEQHIYERTLPGAQGKTSQESHYEQLTHKDKSIYSNMESTAGKY
ncbi:uncharacterized protein LOC143933776 isoform X5 [Lithobates pipiens]